MANNIKVGSTFNLVTILDADCGITKSNDVAIMISNGRFSQVIRGQFVAGENNAGEVDAAIADYPLVVVLPTTTGGGVIKTDGYVKLSHKFTEAGRYEMSLCLYDNGTTGLDADTNSGGTAVEAKMDRNDVISKTKEDKVIPVLTEYVTVYEDTTEIKMEDKLTKELIDEKKA